MQILGLLGIYFDAIVAEVKTFFTFIQIGSGNTVVYRLRPMFLQKTFHLFVTCFITTCWHFERKYVPLTFIYHVVYNTRIIFKIRIFGTYMKIFHIPTCFYSAYNWYLPSDAAQKFCGESSSIVFYDILSVIKKLQIFQVCQSLPRAFLNQEGQNV